MSDSIDFRAKDRSSYSIRIIDGTVRMECYLMGSITGGAGTECNHTIGVVKISEFLEAMNSASLEDLMTTLKFAKTKLIPLFGMRLIGPISLKLYCLMH